jgi:predicted SAM-dependent methyltransferase
MQECYKVRNSEGFLVDSCTGEVVDFDNYTYQDYSNLEYYEKVSSSKKKETKKEIRDMKKIILNYLQSVMTEEEKEMFYKILQKIDEEKLDAAYYLAIYEYVLEREGKVVSREYVRFLKGKGLGSYSIRQKKKMLRKILREDSVIHFIYNRYSGDKQEALKIYDLLKRKGILYGKVETRKKILLKYLSDQKLKEKLFEEERMKEIERTLLLLNIRDFDSFSFLNLPV